jgi:ATP-dependent Lhr-like helicase
MRSDDLLAAVFPAQVQCQDNAVTDTIDPPDHPLVFETVRDCLTEAMDLEGHKKVLAAIESGEIEVYGRDTVQPSVFSHQILNAMPYAFLDDAPLEERRARNVSLRRALPEDARDLGSLDPAVIEEESDNAWPRIRDADELHDALLSLVMTPEQVALSRGRNPNAEDIRTWFEELRQANRAFRLANPEGMPVWVAAERVSLYLAAFPDASIPIGAVVASAPAHQVSQDEAVLALLRSWVECCGPFTAGEMAQTLGLPVSDVNGAIAQLEGEGMILRGSYRPGTTGPEFCDRRVLARIHRGTIGRLRQQVEPVSQANFMRFLFEWQHVTQSSKLYGEGGLLDVIEMLQGFEAAAGAVEPDLLSCRVTDYQPFLLDRLCGGGEVVWGRFSQHNDHAYTYNGKSARTSLSRVTPITLTLRESLDWLLDPSEEGSDAVTGAAGEVLEVLSRRGACFISDIVAATRRLPSDVEDAVWLLAAAGRVTSDSLESLRTRINGNPQRPRRASTRRRARPYRRGAYSRWSRLEPVAPMSETIESKAFQFLKRYGVVFPELLAREPMAPRWRDLVRTFRRLEARGEIRGGRFVSGFVGEQFALPEAVETLRKVNRAEPTGNMIAVSACDPLNLVGILTPGERVPALLRNQVVFRDGVPVASWETGSLVNRCSADQDTLARASALMRRSPIEKEAGIIGGPVAAF